MRIQLSQLNLTPAALPVWQTMIEDLGNPPPKRIAKVLGIGERTVYRYHATGRAPRVALLAIFWLTRWGRSAVATKAENDAREMAGLARCFGEDRERLMRQVKELQAAEKMRTDRIQFVAAEAALRGSESQNETFWKVLLEPSLQVPRCETPEAPAAEGCGLRRTPPQPVPCGDQRVALSEEDVERLSSRHDPEDRFSGRARGRPAPQPLERASQRLGGPASLPLASEMDARPGTPASVPPLRGSRAASGPKESES